MEMNFEKLEKVLEDRLKSSSQRTLISQYAYFLASKSADPTIGFTSTAHRVASEIMRAAKCENDSSAKDWSLEFSQIKKIMDYARFVIDKLLRCFEKAATCTLVPQNIFLRFIEDFDCGSLNSQKAFDCSLEEILKCLKVNSESQVEDQLKKELEKIHRNFMIIETQIGKIEGKSLTYKESFVEYSNLVSSFAEKCSPEVKRINDPRFRSSLPEGDNPASSNFVSCSSSERSIVEGGSIGQEDIGLGLMDAVGNPHFDETKGDEPKPMKVGEYFKEKKTMYSLNQKA